MGIKTKNPKEFATGLLGKLCYFIVHTCTSNKMVKLDTYFFFQKVSELICEHIYLRSPAKAVFAFITKVIKKLAFAFVNKIWKKEVQQEIFLMSL